MKLATQLLEWKSKHEVVPHMVLKEDWTYTNDSPYAVASPFKEKPFVSAQFFPNSPSRTFYKNAQGELISCDVAIYTDHRNLDISRVAHWIWPYWDGRMSWIHELSQELDIPFHDLENQDIQASYPDPAWDKHSNKYVWYYNYVPIKQLNNFINAYGGISHWKEQ
jgi:hypothetical protein